MVVNGASRFVQTGGTSTSVSISLEQNGWARYDLSDGAISTQGITVKGQFVQSGGQCLIADHLNIGRNGGTALYDLYDGVLSSKAEAIGDGDGAGQFTQFGGSNTVTGILGIGAFGSSYVLSGGSLSAGSLSLQSYPSAPALLNVTNPSAHVDLSTLLDFGAYSGFSAVPGTTIHMTGAVFKNENTSPAALGGLGNLELIFEGGLAALDTFEAAGRDFGAVAEGFDGNFKLHCLHLGGGQIGQVQLVDSYDNQPTWTGPEALYVDSLILGPGSSLDLNGLALYYISGSIDPAAVIALNGGRLTQVPEPAALTLLVLGGLALMRRRQ